MRSLTALIMIQAACVSAAEFYVDKGHPSASDSNPGSDAAPWLTIQHGAGVAQAGDTVIVKSGNYYERVLTQHAGEKGRPVVFRGEPRRTVQTRGFRTRHDYIRIEGFNITDTPDGWNERQGIFIGSDFVEVVDNYIWNLPSTAIQGAWGNDPYPIGAYVAHNEIYHCQAGLGICGTGWLVEKNEVRRLYYYVSGDCDYSRFFGEDHVIRENWFHGTVTSEIGAAHVDGFQTFDNNGEHVYNVLVERNTVTEMHQGFMGEAEFYYNSSDVIFRNNLFSGGGMGGAWGLCVQEIANVTAVNNTFVDIMWYGIGFDGSHSTGNVVRNNIFCNISMSYLATNGATMTNDYNLVYNCGAPPSPGANDIIDQDPLFEAGGFRLQFDSPARDSGEALAAVDEDHDGVLRPQGAGWDRGAFEWLDPDLPVVSATHVVLKGTADDAASGVPLLWANGVLIDAFSGQWQYELALDDRRQVLFCAEDTAGNTTLVSVDIE